MKRLACLLMVVAGLAGCTTAHTVHRAEKMTADYAGNLSASLTVLAQHQDSVMSFLNNSLDLYQSAIQTSVVSISPGSFEVSHQEQVGRVLSLLSSESEAQAQSYFAAAGASAASADNASTLTAGRKAILDALNSVNNDLTALSKGLSTAERLKFIAGYVETVAEKVGEAQKQAAKDAQTGMNKTPAAPTKTSTH